MTGSNYVEREARAEPVALGPCRCPRDPKPHDQDSAIVVDLFGYGDRADIRRAGNVDGIGAFYIEMLLRGIISWTLLLPDGSPRPISREEIRRLDEVAVDMLREGMDDAWRDDPLPNPSGAPSPDGSQESAGPTQTTRKRQKSTTTS